MVLAFTQEQKEIINANGMSVIEFKYKLQKATQIIGNAVEKAMEALTEFSDRIVKAFDVLKKYLSGAVDTIKLAVEEYCDKCGYETSKRYQFVKFWSKVTRINKYRIWKWTYRTFLARSNC